MLFLQNRHGSNTVASEAYDWVPIICGTESISYKSQPHTETSVQQTRTTSNEKATREYARLPYVKVSTKVSRS